MRIPFDEPDEFGCVGETLWVKIRGNDNYQIENHPLSEHLQLGDIVKATAIDGILTFQRLVIQARVE